MKSAFEYTLQVCEDSVIVTTGRILGSEKKGSEFKFFFLEDRFFRILEKELRILHIPGRLCK